MAAHHIGDGRRHALVGNGLEAGARGAPDHLAEEVHGRSIARRGIAQRAALAGGDGLLEASDRKSTRLNSSHLVISYAVFCLKKKKKRIHTLPSYKITLHELSCNVT